ncbi:MAG: hypothetical protein LBC93_05970 [Synergistaceae bacterium]|jgi:hypothetical protein|nr:hypothetical protein [Synergistaceae bacterium]
MRKISLALLAALIWAAAAVAAPSSSALIGGRKSQASASVTREIKGGITVQLKNMEMSKQYPEYLSVIFAVTSTTDQVISVDYKEASLFDNNGFQWDADSDVRIGGRETRSREIIESVPTQVINFYRVGKDYKVDESYVRLIFIINGEKLVFRNVPSNP